MLAFAGRCYTLFCQLVVTSVLATCAIVGGFAVYAKLTAPVYEPAARAEFYYANDETSTMIKGAVELLQDRGYPIAAVDAFGRGCWPKDGGTIPAIVFFRDNGTIISESTLVGFWTIGDVKARFGRD